MIKEFVPYKEAMVLKELGFNDECLCYYEKDKGLRIAYNYDNLSITNSRFIKDDLDGCAAPLYQQAFRFFREKFNKNTVLFSDGFQWTFDLRWVEKEDIDEYPRVQFPKKEVGREMFNTYEEAEVACLRKLIELCS